MKRIILPYYIHKSKNFIANIYYYITQYSIFNISSPKTKKIVLIFDPKRTHPGLVDRLKAIIGIYYISKINGYNFKILDTDHFKLDKYLTHNKTNWSISSYSICHSTYHIRLMNYEPLQQIPLLTSLEYHIYNYTGKNIIQCQNIPNWENIWHELFIELFKPSEYLEKSLKNNPFYNTKYIAVHIRFVNALELAEPKYSQRPLPSDEKQNLINSCITAITKLSLKSKLPVLVFSDSMQFLSISKENGFHVLDGNIGHITYNKTDNIMLKTFTDLFMISKAESVISLRGKELYESAFPIYGALIGNKHCCIHKI